MGLVALDGPLVDLLDLGDALGARPGQELAWRPRRLAAPRKRRCCPRPITQSSTAGRRLSAACPSAKSSLAAPPGWRLTFTAIDPYRLEGGRIVEEWNRVTPSRSGVAQPQPPGTLPT